MKELNFGVLTKDDVEVRVQQCGISKKGNKWARLLLFKNARVDMNKLDEILGPANWQRRHYECKGIMFCEIGIKINDEWVWKGDAGKPSNTEKEKGEASDSFKRAGFNWGIGRELYTSPDILVYGDSLSLEKKYNQQTKKEVYSCDNKFTVTHFKVENKEITELEISSDDTVVFTYKKGAKKTTKATPKKQTTKTAPAEMDQNTYNALMELSKVMKEKNITEKALKDKYKIKGSLRELEYNAVCVIVNDLKQ